MEAANVFLQSSSTSRSVPENSSMNASTCSPRSTLPKHVAMFGCCSARITCTSRSMLTRSLFDSASAFQIFTANDMPNSVPRLTRAAPPCPSSSHSSIWSAHATRLSPSVCNAVRAVPPATAAAVVLAFLLLRGMTGVAGSDAECCNSAGDVSSLCGLMAPLPDVRRSLLMNEPLRLRGALTLSTISLALSSLTAARVALTAVPPTNDAMSTATAPAPPLLLATSPPLFVALWWSAVTSGLRRLALTLLVWLLERNVILRITSPIEWRRK
mmetsp:Transcript_6279/g.10789  ORF Transcript_6279/g.10789 Transcript_6279/m.10789 type:complete len:270 (-) Transcript_6279:1185-1994(-)